MVLPVFGYFFGEWLSKVWNGEYQAGNNGIYSNYMGRLKYSDRKVSQWLLDQVKRSEGLEYKAYTATPYEAKVGHYTIGYGTSYLFLENGSAFDTGYARNVRRKGLNGVRANDTISGLKSAMGYKNLSDTEFATRLIVNHTYSKGGAYEKIARYLDLVGTPFMEVVRDALQEWSYGSQGIVNYFTKNSNHLLDAIKTGDKNMISYYYVLLRIGYYQGLSAWNPKKDSNALSNRFSWVKRVFVTAMHIRGVRMEMADIDRATNRGGAVKRLQHIQNLFKSDLKVSVNLV